MKEYIDKAVVKAWIKEKKIPFKKDIDDGVYPTYLCALMDFEDFLDTLEEKKIDTWHLQEKEDIYDTVKDWNLHTFACIMKDGTIQRFSGILDEDCEGHISVHIDGVNDDYDNVDDIVK